MSWSLKRAAPAAVILSIVVEELARARQHQPNHGPTFDAIEAQTAAFAEASPGTIVCIESNGHLAPAPHGAGNNARVRLEAWALPAGVTWSQDPPASKAPAAETDEVGG